PRCAAHSAGVRTSQPVNARPGEETGRQHWISAGAVLVVDVDVVVCVVDVLPGVVVVVACTVVVVVLGGQGFVGPMPAWLVTPAGQLPGPISIPLCAEHSVAVSTRQLSKAPVADEGRQHRIAPPSVVVVVAGSCCVGRVVVVVAVIVVPGRVVD